MLWEIYIPRSVVFFKKMISKNCKKCVDIFKICRDEFGLQLCIIYLNFIYLMTYYLYSLGWREEVFPVRPTNVVVLKPETWGSLITDKM